MSIRVLIVDDRAVVRTELHSALELFGHITVVGEAVDGWDAVEQAKELSPDIVLMDLEMPGLDGFEATRLLKAGRLARAVIALTVHGDEYHRQKALDCGADAFLVKGVDLEIILEILEQFHFDRPADILNS